MSGKLDSFFRDYLVLWARIAKKPFLSLLLCNYVLLPGPVFAAPLASPPDWARKACTYDDIIGHHYKIVFLDETPRRGEAIFYNSFPYHYIAFYPNFTYSFIGLNKEVAGPVELEKKLLWPLQNKQHLTYYVSKNGELILYFNKDVFKRYSCTKVLRSVGDFLKNDLILIGYTKRAKSIVYILYRFWY